MDKDRRYLDGFRDGMREIYEYTLRLLGRGHTPSEIRILLRTRVSDRLIGLQGGLQAPKGEIRILPGESYLFTTKFEDALSAFLSEVVDGGRNGMCIVRVTPDRLMAAPEGDIRIFWLTSEPQVSERHENIRSISPGNMQNLFTEVHEFVDGTREGVILFEGVEYIRDQIRDFGPVMQFINMVRDKVYNAGASLIMYVDEGALTPLEFGKIRRAIDRTVR